MKKALAFILLIALCLTLASCNGELDFIFGGYDYDGHAVALAAEKIELNYNEYKQEGYPEFLDKLSAFAAKLTYEIYSDSEGGENIAISPISVYMALALATECADGETREEILSAVGVSYDEVTRFTKYLYAYANEEYYTRNYGEDAQLSAFLELANSIWADNNLKLNDNGVNNLANNFHADLYKVDFKTDEGEKAIGAYIKDKTHGLIDGDIDRPPETLITLINTFYLKEIWNPFGNNLPFMEGTYNFVRGDGKITETKLLRGYYNNGKVYEGEGYSSFFTTTEHNIKIKFILPKNGYSLSDVFTEENIYNATTLSDYGYVDHENKLRHHTRVLFPEYKADYDGDIEDILREKFGIERMFDPDLCDFSNITDEPIFCDGVIHKCSLTVNKKGIEGAAVTYIPGLGAAGPDEYTDVYHDYVIDRAFGYVITDSYGTVLFSGVVNSID